MKTSGGKVFPGLMAAAALIVGAAACVVPPFSTLQDARMAGPGRVELTPFYSSVGASNDGETNHVQDDFGLQGNVGLISWADLGFRYEYIRLSGSDSSDGGYDTHVFAAGPKFSLVKDRLALSLPVGFGVGENVTMSETWQIHPTLLVTLPLAKVLDLNASAKVLIPFQKDRNTLYALNLGLGIRPGSGALIIRPETGLLFDPEGEGFYFHISVGLSARFGK